MSMAMGAVIFWMCSSLRPILGRADFVPDYDLDCHGAVDVADIQAVAAAWGS